MLKAFPKIFALGQRYVTEIFLDDVEVSEKIDGSQFVFGKINGELHMRSKGAALYPEAGVPNLFVPAVNHVLKVQDRIPDGVILYGETLCRGKHNALTYSTTPKNNIALFAVCNTSGDFISNVETLEAYVEILEIDCAPIIYRGKLESIEEVMAFMGRESFLGGTKIEGIVIKNYFRPFLLGGTVMPLMVGKLVSEHFKEINRKEWTGNKSTTDSFISSFKTEARWEKAVQRLKESDRLLGEPKDIGSIIKEVHADIIEEETEDIKEWLYNHHIKQLCRASTAGLPEWYKSKLLENSKFEGGNYVTET